MCLVIMTKLKNTIKKYINLLIDPISIFLFDSNSSDFKNYTIAIPVYKCKTHFENVLEHLILLPSNYINQIIFFIEPTPDIKTIINIINKSKISTVHDVVMYMNKTIYGMVDNWNQCLSKCETDYLIINHDDDYIGRKMINYYDKLFSKYPNVALIGGKAKPIGFRGKLKGLIENFLIKFKEEFTLYKNGEVDKFLVDSHHFFCSSVCFNMSVLKKNYFFDRNFPYSADEEFWTRILLKNNLIRTKKSFVTFNFNRENYEIFTWKKSDFAEQYVNIYLKLLSYSSDRKYVGEILYKRLLTAFKRINQYNNDFHYQKWLESFRSRIKI